MTAVYAAITAGIVKLGKSGVVFRDVRDSFRNLASSQGQDAEKMLTNLRKLSAGTVDDLELMKQANNALLLGLPVDKFGQMVKIARGAAKATGQSMKFLLNSITTGIGRQSKLMLDNLGIIISAEKAYENFASQQKISVDSMTDAQKKTAFLNEALRKGNDNLRKQGGITTTAADKWTSFGVTIANVKSRISVLLIPAFREVIRTTEPMLKKFDELSKHPFVGLTIKAMTKGFTILNVVIEGFTNLALSKFGVLAKAIPLLLKGSFSEAKDAILADTKSISDIVAEQRIVMNDRLALIDADFLEVQREKKLTSFKDSAAELEAARLEAEALRIEAENEAALLELQRIGLKDEEISLLQTTNALKLTNKKLKIEKDFAIRVKLLKDKSALLDLKREELSAANDKKVKLDRLKFDTDTQNRRISMFSAAGNLITAIGGKENKAGFLISRAAAFAGAIVSSNLAAAKALAFIPPPANIPAAATIKATGLLNAAAIAATTISGLEDGGIVPSRPGGSVHILGEGGQDEAVIPLGEGGGLGPTININVGFMLGDEAEAREAARFIDTELLKLRQDNESVSFDTDVT